MKRRLSRSLITAVAIVCAIFVVWRLDRASIALAHPTIVTPEMDVHAVVSPALDARWTRILERTNVRPPGDRPKLIALTFDDGPYPVETPLLLGTLRALDVPATFFLIGRDAEEFPGLVREIASAGDEIADHTQNHPNLDRLDASAVRAELRTGAQTLERIVPVSSAHRLFRPPHGRYNETTLRAASELGFETVLWNDDPGDWRLIPTEAIVDHVLAYACAPEILLLHSGRRETTAALPTIVAAYRHAGYRFVTVGEMLAETSVDFLNHPRWEALPR